MFTGGLMVATYLQKAWNGAEREKGKDLCWIHLLQHTPILYPEVCFCGRLHNMRRAMRDVADQTGSESTKVALGSCLGFCVRGGDGDPFSSSVCAVFNPDPAIRGISESRIDVCVIHPLQPKHQALSSFQVLPSCWSSGGQRTRRHGRLLGEGR